MYEIDPNTIDLDALAIETFEHCPLPGFLPEYYCVGQSDHVPGMATDISAPGPWRAVPRLPSCAPGPRRAKSKSWRRGQ